MLQKFGVFELNRTTGELTKRGAKVRLHDKPFQVLAALLEHPGELVTREALQERLWPGETFVDFDNNLNAAVRKVRQALGDSADSPRFVETLPKRGYRFIAPVEDSGSAAGAGPDPETSPERPSAMTRAWVFAGIGLAAIGGVLWFGVRLGSAANPPSPVPPQGKAMLVVLPFENLDQDPEREYFCDGLTEEMIAQLGRLQPEALGVIARTSSMLYKGTDKPVDRIGEELGVDYVLEGSVRSADGTARITAQLIQVSDQTHLWAETYDAPLADLLEVQGNVAIQIARVLALELLPDRPLAQARSGTRVTQAYERLLRGRHEWNRFSSDAYVRAIDHFEEALRLDPGYAEAWAGLANAYNLRSFSSDTTPTEMLALARDAAQRALEIDEGLAEAHAALGFVELYAEFDLNAADRRFRRALELRPNYAMAYHWHAGALSALQRHDEAIAAMRQAVELDPVSLSVLSDAGWYFLFADRHREGLEECRRTLERQQYGWARSCAIQAHIALGEEAEALAILRAGWGDPGSMPQPLRRAIENGPAGEALRALHRADLEAHMQDPVMRERYPMELAFAAAQAGDPDAAFEWLEQAYGLRSPWLVFLEVDPRLDSLAGDPRRDALARRIGLPAGG